jgi:hypothetical protein
MVDIADGDDAIIPLNHPGVAVCLGIGIDPAGIGVVIDPSAQATVHIMGFPSGLFEPCHGESVLADHC